MRGPIARSRLTRLLMLSAVVAFAAIGLSSRALASHAPAGTTLWGYEAATSARILQYDVGTDTFVSSCIPTPSGNGRGIAFDPVDGNLWYTFVGTSPTFAGDGLIHKTTPSCAPAGVIPFGDGPGLLIQDDVGALDVDPDDGNIWAAGYHPIGGNSFLYKVNRITGAILASCSVPFGGGGEGNDTLTEAKLSGLPGSGSYLLTDAGEDVTSPNALLVVDEATCVGGGPGTVVTTFTKTVGMTGIDYELSNLFSTNLSTIYSLGGQPFASVVASMTATPSNTLEDITLKAGGTATTLTLTPKAATNPVGTQHCVTAAVADTFGNPVAGTTVYFSVSGANSASGSAATDANGQAQFCYTGTVAGTDLIGAFADTNNNAMFDAGEPRDEAGKVWLAGAPARLVLTPPIATNPVGDQHCVTATVTDAFGNPTPGITVQFTVVGAASTFSTPSSGSATTNGAGVATFCFTAALPGVNGIHAFADTNNSGSQDPGEPFGDAEKTWILPVGTALCEIKVTDGGHITAINGDSANFGGVARSDESGNASGNEEYQDHGPATPMNVKATEILAITCTPDFKTATVYGTATIDGSGSYAFRIRMTDNNEPGKGFDVYGILLSNGYNSGDKVLDGGNIQIHKL